MEEVAAGAEEGLGAAGARRELEGRARPMARDVGLEEETLGVEGLVGVEKVHGLGLGLEDAESDPGRSRIEDGA